MASSTVFTQLLPLVSLAQLRGVCFRSQRLRLALLMGEFSDSFLTVVAATVMLYGLCSTLLQQWFSSCNSPAPREDALCRARRHDRHRTAGLTPFTLVRTDSAMLFALRSIRRSMARPIPGAPFRLRFHKQACRLRQENRCEVAPFPAGLPRFRFVPTQGSRQNGPLAWRRLSLALALVGPARRWLRRRCSSRLRIWPFPPFAGERKRSQTLKLPGGNTSWLTPNPSLKSAWVASRIPFSPTKPKAARGTMSPSPASTRMARHGRWQS